MHATHYRVFRKGFRILILACLAVCIPCAVFPQQITNFIFVENFEDGIMKPNEIVHKEGTFNSEPGIKSTAVFGSTKAFGFGESACSVNCWYSYTSTLRIEFPEPVPIALITFREAELDGNWGSTGYVCVDGQVVEDGEFQRTPWNDGIADTTYRSHTLVVNRIGKNVEFRVVDITGTSEMFVDDIRIAAYKTHTQSMFSEDFNDFALGPQISVLKKGTYTKEPGFRSSSELFGGSTAWGFGRSDCRSGAWDSYVTRLVVELPEPRFIEAVSFKEAEQDTNWGNQGEISVDEHTVPNSTFGRMPGNDSGADTTFRTHYIPVNRMGQRIVLRVWDITSLGEILIDDLQILMAESKGKPFLFEDFEDNALAPGISVVTTGAFGSNPGITKTDSLGGQKAFGFGESSCGTGCFHDYESSLFLDLPKEEILETLSFKAMELHGNWGSTAELSIDGEKWTGVDFSRLPANDLKADSSYRSYCFLLGYPVHRIEWKVWDISNASEVFVDDIALFVREAEAVGNKKNQPLRFDLFQNFPNPFNASTVITYSISNQAHVVVDIYNDQGRWVDKMDLGKQPSGTHRVTWDGSRFASGTYFCEIKTPSTVKVLKMSLIR